jgi:hypothetical protein
MDNPLKDAREYAWNWFALHAAQRMQTFNFFLVVTGFLVAAYASLLDKNHAAAMVIAMLEAWLAIWFNRIDIRSRELVKAGERALAAIEVALAKSTSIDHLIIVSQVENVGPGSSSYRRVIAIIKWTIFWVSLVGACYAAWLIVRFNAAT